MCLVLRISKNWHFWPPSPSPTTSTYVIYEWSLRVLITDSYKLASSFLYVNVFATVSKEMIRMNYSVKLRMSATTAPFSHKHASPPAIFLLFLATRASKTPEANKLWFEKLVFMFMNINVLSFIWYVFVFCKLIPSRLEAYLYFEPSLNTQFFIKGLLVVWDFCFWAVWAAGPVYKKKLGADYKQLLRAVFSMFLSL